MMTKQELIEMTGSEEQANYTVQIILKQLKPEFVRQCVKAELAGVEAKVKTLKEKDVIYTSNGTERINWKADRDGCYEADRLLYQRNRLKSLIAIR